MSTSHFSGPVSSAAGFVDTGSSTNTLGTATVTTLTATTATVTGGLQQSFQAITAGTTQTQAGATAWVSTLSN